MSRPGCAAAGRPRWAAAARSTGLRASSAQPSGPRPPKRAAPSSPGWTARPRPCRPAAKGLSSCRISRANAAPCVDVDAKGVFYGARFTTTRAHFARAVMEGVAYSLRHNLETAQEAGVEAGVLRAMGGAANSRLWTQIKADVTGRRVGGSRLGHGHGLRRGDSCGRRRRPLPRLRGSSGQNGARHACCMSRTRLQKRRMTPATACTANCMKV